METPEKLESLPYIPEVQFDIADVDEEAEFFYHFIKDKDSGRWVDFFTKLFPDLIKKLEGIEGEDEALTICKKYVTNLHQASEAEMIASKKIFQTEWSKIEKDFLSTLSEHFETDWPVSSRKIIGSLTVLPVYPRDLDKYSFYLGYKNISEMIEVSAHEIVHFLWFKKWKEVFPEMKRSEYESPHLTWRLSEIIDPIILQCQPAIRTLIKPKSWGYSSFKKIKIGESGMTEYFMKVYTDSVSAGNDFETTMKILWTEAQKNEKEISVF